MGSSLGQDTIERRDDENEAMRWRRRMRREESGGHREGGQQKCDAVECRDSHFALWTSPWRSTFSGGKIAPLLIIGDTLHRLPYSHISPARPVFSALHHTRALQYHVQLGEQVAASELWDWHSPPRCEVQDGEVTLLTEKEATQSNSTNSALV